MRQHKVDGFPVITETMVEKCFPKGGPLVRIVVKKVPAIAILTAVKIFSYCKTGAMVVWEFRFDPLKGSAMQRNSKELNKLLALHRQELQRLVGRNSGLEPKGRVGYKWKIIQPSYRKPAYFLCEFTFRLEIRFEPDHENREALVDAGLRILASYADAFGILRRDIGPYQDQFKQYRYVMVRREGKKKAEKVPLEVYYLEKHGF